MSDSARILIAEDNDFVRLQIVQYLQGDGHEVVEARDGNEALDVVRDQEIDMAVVDVRMEPLDGFEFIRALRALELKTPVILVTGDDAPDLLAKASEFNVSAVLIKPVQKDRLLKAVERALFMAKRAAG
jgi:CheY-like chemotaxis protein